METSFVNELILLIVAAFIGGFVARSLKLPPVVGYIVGGIVFGAVGKAFIPSYEHLFQLSEMGIALLLFTLGFEVSLNAIKKMGSKIVYISLLQVALTTLFTFPILILFHLSFPVAFLFSILFSFSSTAVVLKILEEKGMVNNFPGNNVFAVLLIQDLFIVPVIFLIPLLFAGEFLFPQTIVSFLTAAIKPLVAFVGMYLIGRLILFRILHILFRFPQQELTILATLFTAVASIGLLTYAGLPQAIAAFFAGVLISEQGRNLAPLSAVKPLRDVLLILFFVLIGMLVNINTLVALLPAILTGTIIIILIKFFVLFFVLRFFKFIPSANVFISSHLSNIGEFAIVVAQIAFIGHFITRGDYELLLAMFISSLILIPLLTNGARVLYEKSKRKNFVKRLVGDSNFLTSTVYDGIENHVIILGHGRVGKEVRNLLEMGEIPYVVVDFDRRTIDALTSSMKNALYGDPSDADVLESAGIKKAKVLVVALPDSKAQKIIIKNALHINPKLMVLCRSHIDEDKYELVNLGVNTIVIPEFEAGLRIGKKVLELLGFSDKNTLELLRKLRKFHYVH